LKLLLRCLTHLSACAVTTIVLAAPVVKRGPVVVLGDSLSAGYGLRVDEGWVTLLKQRMHAAGYVLPVVNASVSGETTTGGMGRIARVLVLHQPSVLVLELGANDALRGLPASTIEDNLVAITQAAQKAGAQVLLVGTPLPTNYGDEYGQAVARAYQNTSRRTHTRLIPSMLAGIAPEAANFQADRLHPTASAQSRILDNVWPVLRSLLPNIHTE